ncbi:MAG: hypothetical protein ACFFBP_12235 [Promethearchaeota archaeon]
MTRKFTPGRWNYSQKSQKWVYVTINKNGKRKYKYQIEPPEEFVRLSEELRRLNIIQAQTTDPEENMKLFHEMKKLAQKMQAMTMNNE